MVSDVKPSDVDRFARDGVVCLRGALDETWVERLQAATAEAMANPVAHTRRHGAKDANDAAFFAEIDIYRRHPVFNEFATAGPLRPIAARLLNSTKLNLYGDQLLVKEAGTSTPTPWHHDQPYWRLKGTKIMSMWVALDVVGSENGAVEYVRGSHLDGKLYRPQEFGDDKRFKDMTLDRLPDINSHRNEFDIVSYDMQPGDVIAFHARTLHGSPPNHSTRSRRALSVRYIGDDVVYDVLPGQPGHSIVGDVALKPGDVLDSDDYPVVWRSSVLSA